MERYDGDWAAVEQREIAFTRARSDVLEYEALIEDLEEAAAVDARAVFHLIRRNFKSAQQFAELLGDIFSPLRKRNKDRHAQILTVRRVFEALEEET